METKKNDFIISADLAQVNDYCALTIFERIESEEPINEWESRREYHLRHIERPERGTTYPKIVDRLKELAESSSLAENRKFIAIDVTGVGRPVWDLMIDSGLNRESTLIGIQITGGNNVTRSGYIYNVPKRDLISALQVAFQNGQLKIAKGLPDADMLVRELTNFKVKINLNGHDQYEAWREGIHDDIVLSAAMGIWLGTYFHTEREKRLLNARRRKRREGRRI